VFWRKLRRFILRPTILQPGSRRYDAELKMRQCQ
jgi:hypothetical protein